MTRRDCEILLELRDPAIGLSGWLAVDTTARGPAFGGVRAVPYRDAAACRADAVRLARAMTLKCAFHEIPGGGGKIVLDASAIVDRDAVMRAVGEAVDALDGAFFTATDSGTTPADLERVAERTRHVSREPVAGATADGVLHAVRAVCEVLGTPPADLRVVVQGLGEVGGRVARRLARAGARVRGCDLLASRERDAQGAGVRGIPPGAALSTPCDLFSPCGRGGQLGRRTARRVPCRAIVGSANNLLADPAAARILHERGVLLVPDFVASGGGLIRGAWVHLRGTPGTDAEVAAVYDRTLACLRESARTGRPPEEVAREAAGLPEA